MNRLLAPCVLLATALAASNALAEIYKVVGPDGKITYSDREPQAAAKADRLKIQPSSGGTSAAAPRVVLFSAQWCGVCREAKSYMASRSISYEEWDVDKSDYAQAKLREFGTRAVPVILVGNQKMIGFSSDRLEAMLKSAAPR